MMADVRILSVFAMFHVLIVFVWGDRTPSTRSVSPEQCFVWGPGLLSDIVVPVRYFYIQAVDQHGQNFTESVGATAFTLSVTKSDGSRVHVQRDVIDRRDGTYIGRFRLNQMSLANLLIWITYNDDPVAGSPYTLKGPVYDEGCQCPQPDLHDWFSLLECPESYPQLHTDLAAFPSPVDFRQVAKEAVDRFSKKISHYKIIDNKVYKRDYFGKNIGIGIYVDEFLLSLLRKHIRGDGAKCSGLRGGTNEDVIVKLPDVEFIMNMSDWPLEKRSETDHPLPVVSWCGSDDTRDIVLPTYELIKSTIYMLERHNTDPFSVQGRTGPTWRDKTDQAFWRGRDSNKARLDLAVLAQKHPDVLNASITRMSFFPKDEKYGPLSPHISFFDFFEHKYQVSIDGTVAAYRMPFLLASDTVVFKQDSKYYEHFYKSMEPYVHYIPVKEDLSDLLEQIAWAKKHDKQTEAVGRQSQEFVLAHLTPKDIYCYYARFLYEFSKILKSRPELEEDFVPVKPGNLKPSTNCECQSETENVFSHSEL